MKRDLTLFLEDILESIILIEQYTKGMNMSHLDKNSEAQDAVARRIEIIKMLETVSPCTEVHGLKRDGS